MNQFSVILRSDRRLFVGWSVGLGAFVLLLGAVYSSLEDPEALTEVLDNYPEELREVFGASDDIGTVRGFLKAELGGYLPLTLGIFGVMFMTKHLAGAEDRGSLDHALARPVTRTEYYLSVYLAGIVGLVGMLVAGAIGGIIGFSFGAVGADDLAGVAWALLEMLPLALVYLSVGAVAGVLFHHRGQANGMGIGVVLASFSLDIVSRLVDGLEDLSYVTVHGYLGRSDWAAGDVDAGYLVFCATVSAVLLVVGASLFDKKDLYA